MTSRLAWAGTPRQPAMELSFDRGVDQEQPARTDRSENRNKVQIGRFIALWIARHVLAFVLILAVLIGGRVLYQWGWPKLQAERQESQEIARRQDGMRSALERLREEAPRWQQQVEARFGGLRNAATGQLQQRLQEIPGEMARHERARLTDGGLLAAAAMGQTDRIVAHYRAPADIAMLTREKAWIEAMLTVRSRTQTLSERRRDAVVRHNLALARERAALEAIVQIQDRPLAGPRNWLCGTVRAPVGCTNYRALVEARRRRDAAKAVKDSARRMVGLIDRTRATIESADAIAADASALGEAQSEALERQLRALDDRARDNWWAWFKRPIMEMWDDALLILAIAIFGPALIKALLYFVVAPAASRRPPLRLRWDERGEVDDAAFVSAVSQRIEIAADQELLVVPEAVQSSPHSGAKSTKWLLNPDLPLSSLASGLVALVRFRGAEGAVQVTATGDPLAEIALLRLPAGSAMVVRPRALRGVVHPAGRPVAVTRHWRFGLSAWLALQFRYLVFHGPCTLLVQGSRGVRLERAGRGRGINRAATVAFSAGLDFSVRRSEAFAPYLMGRQDLLNHSFEGGSGFLVYEEMPRSGQRSGVWGRGLAGLGDAALKTIGV